MKNRNIAAWALAVLVSPVDSTSCATEFTFSNPAQIAIPASGSVGSANPYPSNLTVAGVGGILSKITVSLNGLSHTCAPDLDVLLKAPTGQSSLLMSDCASCLAFVSNVTLGFDDAAANQLPEAGAGSLQSGVFRPTNSNPVGDSGDTFNAPAPNGPYATSLSVFEGIDPNGVWQLFVTDDTGGDAGDFARGWTLNLTVIPEPTGLAMASLGFAGILLGRSNRRRDT